MHANKTALGMQQWNKVGSGRCGADGLGRLQRRQGDGIGPRRRKSMKQKNHLGKGASMLQGPGAWHHIIRILSRWAIMPMTGRQSWGQIMRGLNIMLGVWLPGFKAMVFNSVWVYGRELNGNTSGFKNHMKIYQTACKYMMSIYIVVKRGSTTIIQTVVVH